MYCSKCGKEIKDDSAFCPYCGNPVKHNQADAAVSKNNDSDIQKPAPDNRSEEQKHTSHRTGITIGVVAVIAVVIILGVNLYQEEQEAKQEQILAEQEAEERSKLSEINVIEVKRAVSIVDDFLSGDKLATEAWIEMAGVLDSIKPAETEESVEITKNVKACIQTIFDELEKCRLLEGLSGDKSVILENRNKIAEYAELE